MNLRFLLPGKCREPYIKGGYDEFLKRLSRFGKVSLINLPEENLPSNPSEGEIKKALEVEADRALKQIKDNEYLCLVDIHAKMPNSNEFAKKIKEATNKNGNLVFLLGSSYGLSDRLRQRANYSFSLSPMTFTHYLAMLLTIEQVYRAFKINSGETYDK